MAPRGTKGQQKHDILPTGRLHGALCQKYRVCADPCIARHRRCIASGAHEVPASASASHGVQGAGVCVTPEAHKALASVSRQRRTRRWRLYHARGAGVRGTHAVTASASHAHEAMHRWICGPRTRGTCVRVTWRTRRRRPPEAPPARHAHTRRRRLRLRHARTRRRRPLEAPPARHARTRRWHLCHARTRRRRLCHARTRR
jgi:hypothetical protein